VANPLLDLVYRLFGDSERGRGDTKDSGATDAVPEVSGTLGSGGVFLVLRRMRIPLIVLIVIFAVSVLGLTLIPGQDPQGRTMRLSVFEAFYFMSYTASTIGFGELPYPFTPAQRMWVTFTIFLSVIGWAYAVGSVLALMHDQAFRRELARRHFARKVTKLAEPFLLLVGYGDAAKRLARSLDEMGRRFVLLDKEETRVVSIELDSYRADTPALLAEARDTANLALAGLGHANCEGVVALAGDDDVNLDVAMTSALLRPGLRVIARTHSQEIAKQMQAFGEPEIINPLDRFGNHLRILIRSPAAYQLMMWLTSTPGAPLPPRRDPLPHGRWVVCGYGRFGRELTEDLRAEGIEVTVVEGPDPFDDARERIHPESVTQALEGAADLQHATAVVAATEIDTTNLWLLQVARQANPDAYRVALQNRAGNASLFHEVGVDFGMVPAEVIEHEVLARLANPMLMRFLPLVPHQSDEWATDVVERLVRRCGACTPTLGRLRLTDDEAPALTDWLAAGEVRLGDLLRNPKGRERSLDLVTLAVLRNDDVVLTPDDDYLLQAQDALLLAGGYEARRSLDSTLVDRPTAAYVIGDRFVASSAVWRRLAGHTTGPTSGGHGHVD
jgi:Trk K+ transport system NAD-binding subunit